MKFYIKISIVVILIFLYSCSVRKNVISEDYEDIYTVEKQNSEKEADSENNRLYNEVDKWLGTPYKYAGSSRDGVDCSGFVCQIYKIVYNIKLERNSSAIFYKNCQKIEKENLKEGDLVFFCTKKNSRKINHVGIYLKDDKFVHASSCKGVIINSLNKPYYVRNYICSGRVLKR